MLESIADARARQCVQHKRVERRRWARSAEQHGNIAHAYTQKRWKFPLAVRARVVHRKGVRNILYVGVYTIWYI